MELVGTRELNAAPDKVWQALFSRDVLEKAIPGCESLEQTSDTTFIAVVKLKIGPVSARFKGEVELATSTRISHALCLAKDLEGSQVLPKVPLV